MTVEFNLAPIFSDHMVLCRNKNIRIFGCAPSGRTISIAFNHSTASCKAVKGRFQVVLPPMQPGGPYAMSVSDGNSTISLSDVFIGDVYLAGGQSNMELQLKDSLDGKAFASKAENPMIRYCNYPVQAYLDEKTLAWEKKTQWRVANHDHCGEMSAVAYHFADKLQLKLNIPIGIIDCYLGGTSITAWLDEDALSASYGGKKYLEDYLDRNKNQTDEKYQKALNTQQREHAVWSRGADTILLRNPSAKWEDFISELGPCPWPPPEGHKSVYRPCGLVNTMVKRIAPYTLTGFLYYQGESDYMHPHLYRAFMMSLITFWRDLFMEPALPFLFVQLPMFNHGDDTEHNSWAILRHAQEQVYLDMRNTGLAVILDCGEKDDIHPKDKQTVGYRLYQQALRVVYHLHAEVSPRAVSAFANGHRMTVTLSSALQDQINPLLFELAGDNEIYYKANAKILGSVILLTSEEVPHPRFVRYAWVNYGEVNVFGENGLPLAPFSIQ